jgi:predicted secreted hydrolase
MKTGVKHAFLAFAVSAAVLMGCAANPLARQSDTSATLEGLRRDANTERFARALAPREFVFPQDHGPHNDYQTEWWYYTGNLTTTEGRHFGYQFTIFRRALVPPAEQVAVVNRPSSLAFTQLYFAHLAITDSAANEHVSFEKYSRSAAGLAGAQADPFRVFIEDWVVRTSMGTGSAEAVQIRAQQNGYAIDLNLTSSKPIVFHGDRGLSAKSKDPGNASYYYSMTRMATQGQVTTPQDTFRVTGSSWLDREWSTSVLTDNTAGWDWFALQFDDGREVMYFKLREKGTGGVVFDKGTWVESNGDTALITSDRATIDVLETWASPTSGAVYPVKWRMTIPEYGVDITITPRLKDQEMNLSQRYWEGAVTVEGTAASGSVRGVGYVELTGYDASGVPTR